MAIDSRIVLAGGPPVDIGKSFSNSLLNIQRGQQIAQNREEAPFRNRLLEAQAGQAEAGAEETGQLNRIRSLAVFGSDLLGDIQSGNLASIRAKTVKRIGSDLPSQGLPTNDSQELLQLIDNPDIPEQDKLAQISQLAQQANDRAVQFGALKAPAASQRNKFIGTPQRISRKVADPETGEMVSKNFLSGVVQNQDGSFTRQDVPVDGSFLSTIGETPEQQSTRLVVEAGDVAGAKVEGEVAARAKAAPTIAKTKSLINTQVKLAEKAATERGDVLNDLGRMQAALPGLTDVVGKLKELAPIATSTFGGRVYDAAVKELGFGATKGATASTKFGAMVNNQILPLLKPTFGGSFSVQEGQELKATMGDKNLSVAEKLTTLDAFLEQKQRDVETKQLQLDGPKAASGEEQAQQVLRFDAQGNLIQ